LINLVKIFSRKLYCLSAIFRKTHRLATQNIGKVTSAWRAITHEQDMPAVGFAGLRQSFDQLVAGGGGGGRRNDGIGILAERDMI
jgi:hypothetical protein